jgi:hypothetical protein
LAHDLDFMDLFTPDAPWKFAAAHTQVFKLYGSYLGHAPQEQVDILVADLNRRHIDIALENGVIDVPNKPTPPCGGLGIVEGYGTPDLAKRVCEEIKHAGGKIKYLVMDEPLYTGHFSNRPHTCHSPVSLLLSLSIPTLETYLQEFPDIIIGEVEPTRFPSYAGGQDALKEWIKGYNDTLGRPLAFMQLDVPWTDDGHRVPGADYVSREPDDAVEFYRDMEEFRRQGLLGGLGIIFDGTPLDSTDSAWVQDARDHVEMMEGKYGLHPDQIIFQSWMPHPSHALPETQPDTLTGLVDWYVRRHARDESQTHEGIPPSQHL